MIPHPHRTAFWHNMAMARDVFFVSDRTGITAETLGQSLLAQFDGQAFNRQSLRFIDTPEKAEDVVQLINQQRVVSGESPIVFSTLVDEQIRTIIAGCQGTVLDLMGTFILPLEEALGRHSSHRVGHLHGHIEADDYNRRMDAVNYALATDDGLTHQDYSRADVILLGVSRSGKTPTCLYLALTFGIYAANYPLTPDDLDKQALPALLGPHRAKLFGLTIDPLRLQQLRQERRRDSDYASLKQCQFEVRQAEALYRRERITYVASTTISVEEIATTIVHTLKLDKTRR